MVNNEWFHSLFKYSSINHPENSTSNKKNWIGDENEPLKGFSWRSGSKRDTTGVVLWDDVFLHTVEETGEKIAIIVMDTQGLFDGQTTTNGNSSISTLSSLISSLQVFNIQQLIQADQLEYLQFLTGSAKYAAQENLCEAEKPFQNILFLIRDWPNPSEKEYGLTGGKKYLVEALEVKDNQIPELQSLRQNISSSFQKLDCCLLPYPGEDVATNQDFNGSWKSISNKFKDELVILIENLLGPENLEPKKINGKHMTSFEIKVFMKECFEAIQSGDIIQMESVYESAIRNQMNTLLNKCVEHYNESLPKIENISLTDNFQTYHDKAESKSLEMFRTEKKMGESEHENKYRESLGNKLMKIFEEWRKLTEITLEKLKNAGDEEKVKLKEEYRKKFASIGLLTGLGLGGVGGAAAKSVVAASTASASSSVVADVASAVSSVVVGSATGAASAASSVAAATTAGAVIGASAVLAPIIFVVMRYLANP